MINIRASVRHCDDVFVTSLMRCALCALIFVFSISQITTAEGSVSSDIFEKSVEEFTRNNINEAENLIIGLAINGNEKAQYFLNTYNKWKIFNNPEDKKNLEKIELNLFKRLYKSEYYASVLYIEQFTLSSNPWNVTRKSKKRIKRLIDSGVIEAFYLRILISKDGMLDDESRSKLVLAWEANNSKYNEIDKEYWRSFVELLSVGETIGINRFHVIFRNSIDYADGRAYLLGCQLAIRNRIKSSTSLDKLRLCIFSDFFGYRDGLSSFVTAPFIIEDNWDWTQNSWDTTYNQLAQEASRALEAAKETSTTIMHLAVQWCRDTYRSSVAQKCEKTAVRDHLECVLGMPIIDSSIMFSRTPAYDTCRHYMQEY